MPLHSYQASDLEKIFASIEKNGKGYRLLYQLPTGGGKTVIFAEIAKRFIERYQSNVTILTHRNELCNQTARTLKAAGVKSCVVKSGSRVLKTRECACVVAMVETLKNRIKNKKVHIDNVGLVIIDEAHHNSFRKLLDKFTDAIIIGVTATPLSSDKSLPLNEAYDSLIVGESIKNLISNGFLSKPKSIAYDMDLQSLSTGPGGDFTVSSSDALYTTPALLQLLVKAYETNAKGKKTLIFNNGIATSKQVFYAFRELGYPIRHLDNRDSPHERAEILKWFKQTKDAILTSVSILTTGFDEPTVQTVILNRATTSLTLFHQMVGRGSRKLPSKKTFMIIDLGNNTERFGEWNDELDWQRIFERPQDFYAQLKLAASPDGARESAMNAALRAKFPNSLEVGFDMAEAFQAATREDRPHKTAIEAAIRQHAAMCLENGDSISEALSLAEDLAPEILLRTREYAKYLDKPTKSYRDWLADDYARRLEGMVKRMFAKVKSVA
ncbi:MAG: DEAD/DEAH box helicase [Flavobacterium sp.]|uniref:DEAD/DEAH box helicase n=1 Tax=Flavobacterium sp. TaxID=239 RepID=UPI0011FD15F0|nr:DEAD/DEAH box helicase [Flavobacterium sp.]RZJ67484.1 MAG: DEAD/DEAH box helicase [Flavobacterium sp.]